MSQRSATMPTAPVDGTVAAMTNIAIQDKSRATFSRVSLRIGAAAATIAAPLLLLIGTALMPTALGDRPSTDRAKALAVLQDVTPDRSRIPLAIVLVSVGLGLLAAAATALAALAGGRPLAFLGAALVSVGAPLGAAVNAVSGMTVYRLTASDLSQDSAAHVLAWNSGAAGAAMFLLYLLVLVGIVLLSTSLWRSHALSWWNAALIGTGAVVGFAAPEGPIGGVATLPLVVGMTLAARSITQTKGQSWTQPVDAA